VQVYYVSPALIDEPGKTARQDTEASDILITQSCHFKKRRLSLGSQPSTESINTPNGVLALGLRTIHGDRCDMQAISRLRFTNAPCRSCSASWC